MTRVSPAETLRIIPNELFPDEAAAVVTYAVRAVLLERARCRLALAGGSTPGPVYHALAARPDIEWGRLDLFWGDERFVPHDDPASNFRMARECLLEDVEAGSVHPMPVDGTPAEAAARYATLLGDEPLDVALLGMGDDGHTASLFAGSPALTATTTRVMAVQSPAPPRDRLTLTLRALQEAGAVLFLVAGAAKAGRLAEVLQEITHEHPRLPAARVAAGCGAALWLVDEDAASMLHREDHP